MDLALQAINIIVLLYLGIQEVRHRRAERRWQLYERRLGVYLAVEDFLTDLVNRNSNAREEFLQKTREARFLFNAEIASFIDDISRRSVQQVVTKDLVQAQAVSDHDRQYFTRIAGENAVWLFEERNRVREKFAPYLNIK